MNNREIRTYLDRTGRTIAVLGLVAVGVRPYDAHAQINSSEPCSDTSTSTSITQGTSSPECEQLIVINKTLSGLQMFDWDVYDSNGRVKGHDFTETNGTPPPYSPRLVYSVTDQIWEKYKAVQEVARFPTSRQFVRGGLIVQRFQGGYIQANPNGATQFIQDSLLIPDIYQQPQEPEYTPLSD